jgi:hypothetical protein
VQCSSVGCSLAQWKDSVYIPGGPSWEKGSILFIEIVYFFLGE